MVRDQNYEYLYETQTDTQTETERKKENRMSGIVIYSKKIWRSKDLEKSIQIDLFSYGRYWLSQKSKNKMSSVKWWNIEDHNFPSIFFKFIINNADN